MVCQLYQSTLQISGPFPCKILYEDSHPHRIGSTCLDDGLVSSSLNQFTGGSPGSMKVIRVAQMVNDDSIIYIMGWEVQHSFFFAKKKETNYATCVTYYMRCKAIGRNIGKMDPPYVTKNKIHILTWVVGILIHDGYNLWAKYDLRWLFFLHIFSVISSLFVFLS